MTVHHNIKDSDLVKRYVLGEECCLGILIERHQTKIFSFIYHKVLDYDLANDLFQDTFIKVIHTLKKGKYQEEGKFLPWVLTIANNIMMDHFRASARLQKKEISQDLEPFKKISSEDLSIESEILKEELLSKMVKLIDLLPPEQQEALKMRIDLDLSFKEIAAQTNVSINTALGRMRYAILALKKIIIANEIMID